MNDDERKFLGMGPKGVGKEEQPTPQETLEASERSLAREAGLAINNMSPAVWDYMYQRICAEERARLAAKDVPEDAAESRARAYFCGSGLEGEPLALTLMERITTLRSALAAAQDAATDARRSAILDAADRSTVASDYILARLAELVETDLTNIDAHTADKLCIEVDTAIVQAAMFRRRSLNFESLQLASVARCEASWNALADWSVLEWAGAMCGEAGEAANVAKKMRRQRAQRGDNAVTADMLGEELADTICYAVLTAASVGIDLGEAIVKKFNKVSEEIGSPVKLSGKETP